MNISIDASNVLNKLEHMSANLAEGLPNGLARAGELVAAQAKADCPVDTGRLQGSISSHVEGMSAVVGTNVKYGIYVEFGTGQHPDADKSVAHTSKSRWTYYKGGRFYTTSGMGARPFLVPALKNNKDKIIEIIKESIKG